MRDVDIGARLEREERAHRPAPTIAVMPETELPAGIDTESVNGTPGHAQVGTWLTRDVPDFVARTFRVRSDRRSWATMADSAGSRTAAMATVRHPSQYAAGIIVGDYFRPVSSRDHVPEPADSSLATDDDLVGLAAHRPPTVALWVQISKADPLSHPTSTQLLAAPRSPTSVRAVVLKNAGHRASVWISLLPAALTWLGSHVAGFRPAT